MASIITEKTVKNIIGRRNKEIHKGDCGRVLIAAGSPGMAGAAILAAQSALRAGSGLVRTAIPAALFPIVQVAVPEATCVERALPIQSLAEFDAICVGPGLGQEKEGIDFVRELITSYDKTLLIDADGLNIIAHNDFFELLRDRAERLPERTILTPHMGEAARLLAAGAGASPSAAPAFEPQPQNLGTSLAAACGPDSPAGTPLATQLCAARLAPAPEPATLSALQQPETLTDLPTTPQHGIATAPAASQKPDLPAPEPASRQPGAPAPEPASRQPGAPLAFDFSGGASAASREAIAAALVQKTGAIIVLKGAGTLVAAPGRETFTNTTGNPGMATAGAGDALSGIITSLAGQRSQVGTSFARACAPKLQRTRLAATPEQEPEAPSGPVAPASRADLQIGTSLAPACGQKPEAAGKPLTDACDPELQSTSPATARIGAFEAALAGVYIHGLAGDLAAAELGEYGITAGDIALYTAYAIKQVLQEAAGEV